MGGAGRQCAERNDALIAQCLLLVSGELGVARANGLGHAGHEERDDPGAHHEVDPHADQMKLKAGFIMGGMHLRERAG